MSCVKTISFVSDTDHQNLALDSLLQEDRMQLDVLDPNLYQRYIFLLF